MLLGLMRHGVAEDAGPATGFRDETRRLTPEGRRRMEAEGRALRTLGWQPAVIITSPLVRCVETAAIVAEHLEVPVREHHSLAPGARVDAVRDLLAEYPDAESVMMCGHQPDMSLITAELCGGLVIFKKGTVALLDVSDGRLGGAVVNAVYPPRALRMIDTSS